MAASLLKISAGPHVPDEINAVIETPRGSRVRYGFDIEKLAFQLRCRVEGDDGYPADYGFVPSTVSQDFRPLDILVLNEDPTFPGCVVLCRPVAVIHLTDGRQRDSKILAVPVVDERFHNVKGLENLPAGTQESITRFYAENTLISGRRESVDCWEDVGPAKKVVFKAWEGLLA